MGRKNEAINTLRKLAYLSGWEIPTNWRARKGACTLEPFANLLVGRFVSEPPSLSSRIKPTLVSMVHLGSTQALAAVRGLLS